MRRAKGTALIMAALLLAGCGRLDFIGGDTAQIRIGDANEVVIETEQLARPDALANRHCALHGKAAVFDGVIRPSEYHDHRLVYYKCR